MGMRTGTELRITEIREIEVNPTVRSVAAFWLRHPFLAAWYFLRTSFFAMMRVLWLSVKLAAYAAIALAGQFLTNPIGTFVSLIVALTVFAKLIGAPLHR